MVRTPKKSPRDSKFISMNTLSVNDVTTSVRGELMLFTLTVLDEKLEVPYGSTWFGPICYGFIFPVDELTPYLYKSLPRNRKQCIKERMYRTYTSDVIEHIHGKE